MFKREDCGWKVFERRKKWSGIQRLQDSFILEVQKS
jgi:hypothetical protein